MVFSDHLHRNSAQRTAQCCALLFKYKYTASPDSTELAHDNSALVLFMNGSDHDSVFNPFVNQS